MKFKDGLIGHDYDTYYNSNGHRCKEINETNLRNYLLFAGDNLSLALDKPIENTFPYIVSKKFHMDYYNISIFNGGLDCAKNNLICWLSNYPRPKAIIIGFEFLNAIVKTEEGSTTIDYVDYNNEVVKDVMDSGNYSGFFYGRKDLFNETFKNITDIPTYQIALYGREKLFSRYINNIDCGENVFNHEYISEKIISALHYNFEKIKP